MLKIKSINSREIIDSRGIPSVEAEIETEQGIFRASVPSGASKGKYEAVELRDNEKRYFGKGVLKAIKNINEIINPELRGKDVSNQKEIDGILIELDGTKNKSKLGANAILAVSLACCRAGAAAKNLSLYKYISQIYGGRVSVKFTEVGSPIALPIPCFNILEGGVHAGNDLNIQEFMIIPEMENFKENLRTGSEIYHFLKEILTRKFGKQARNLGDEGGFAPSLKKTREALDLIMEACKEAGYEKKMKIGLDCAASQFSRDKKYNFEGKNFSGEKLLNFYQDLIKEYPILFLEDPFSQDDWPNWQKLTSGLSSSKIMVVGDDLTVTNPERIKEAHKKGACNGIILKPNQIGTVTETITAANLAKEFGFKTIVSHRSGETCDDFIADLAQGLGADFIKTGAPARGERVIKYNRLLRIEEELL